MRIGDTVVLVSGGPLMTIVDVASYIGGDSARVLCGWFAKDDTYQTAEFGLDLLVPSTCRKIDITDLCSR